MNILFTICFCESQRRSLGGFDNRESGNRESGKEKIAWGMAPGLLLYCSLLWFLCLLAHIYCGSPHLPHCVWVPTRADEYLQDNGMNFNLPASHHFVPILTLNHIPICQFVPVPTTNKQKHLRILHFLIGEFWRAEPSPYFYVCVPRSAGQRPQEYLWVQQGHRLWLHLATFQNRDLERPQWCLDCVSSETDPCSRLSDAGRQENTVCIAVYLKSGGGTN